MLEHWWGLLQVSLQFHYCHSLPSLGIQAAGQNAMKLLVVGLNALGSSPHLLRAEGGDGKAVTGGDCFPSRMFYTHIFFLCCLQV